MRRVKLRIEPKWPRFMQSKINIRRLVAYVNILLPPDISGLAPLSEPSHWLHRRRRCTDGSLLLRTLQARHQISADPHHNTGCRSQPLHRVLLDGSRLGALESPAERAARDLPGVAQPPNAAASSRQRV